MLQFPVNPRIRPAGPLRVCQNRDPRQTFLLPRMDPREAAPPEPVEDIFSFLVIYN